MNLIVENVRHPDRFCIEKGETVVWVFYFSVFDSDTGEADSISVSVLLRDFEQGLVDLKDNGSCRIPGTHGELSLSIKPDDTLSVTLKNQHKSFLIDGLSYRLVD